MVFGYVMATLILLGAIGGIATCWHLGMKLLGAKPQRVVPSEERIEPTVPPLAPLPTMAAPASEVSVMNPPLEFFITETTKEMTEPDCSEESFGSIINDAEELPLSTMTEDEWSLWTEEEWEMMGIHS